MAHSLIVGQTESGKSCLMKIAARGLAARGHPVLILDPLRSVDWPVGENVSQFHKAAAFDTMMCQTRSAFCFVDEAGVVFENGRDLTWVHWATLSRHYGHSFFFGGQRPLMIPTTMRGQCKRLYCFHLSASDGKDLYDEWGWPELRTVQNLPALDFYSGDKYSPPTRGRIVNYSHIEMVQRDIRNGASPTLPLRGSPPDRDRDRPVGGDNGAETCDTSASEPESD